MLNAMSVSNPPGPLRLNSGPVLGQPPRVALQLASALRGMLKLGCDGQDRWLTLSLRC